MIEKVLHAKPPTQSCAPSLLIVFSFTRNSAAPVRGLKGKPRGVSCTRDNLFPQQTSTHEQENSEGEYFTILTPSEAAGSSRDRPPPQLRLWLQLQLQDGVFDAQLIPGRLLLPHPPK